VVNKLIGIALVLLVGLLGFAISTGFSSGEISMGIKAPAIKGDHWFNTEPPEWGRLLGKVIMVDFWDYTCVNCLRTLPYLEEWHKRYSQLGLVIIGVHAPEFQFAHNPDEIGPAIKRLGIEFPVVMDNDYSIWSDYANRYWPHKYLINKDGYMVYDHIGEGGYGETEAEIQKLLKDIDPNLTFPTIMAPVRGSDTPGAVCYPVTPELYCGYSRGRLGSSPGYIPSREGDYIAPKVLSDGFINLQGQWLAAEEYVQHSRNTVELEDNLSIRYHAAEVNLVMHPGQNERMTPKKVFVKQDDEFLLKDLVGEDVQFDHNGETYVLVDEPRMYRIIKSKVHGEHTLQLFSKNSGVEMYAFTFGSCIIPNGTDIAN